MHDDKKNMNEGLELNGKPIPGYPTGVEGLFASNEDIQKARDEMEEEMTHVEQAHSPELSRLESFLSGFFEDARKWKEDETDTQALIVDSLNRRNGKYSIEKMSKINEAGSSDVFIGLTGVKCRTFESWVHDVYVNSGKKRTWALKPTPIPDLPNEEKERIASEALLQFAREVDQGAEPDESRAYQIASNLRSKIVQENYQISLEKAAKMSKFIHDQLIEGGWVKAFSDAVMDLSSSKACIIKGPIVRNRLKKKGWKKKGKKTVPDVGYEKVITFERVSPLDLYPGRTNKSVNDGPIAEKMFISKESLLSNREEKGYIKDNIEYVCKMGAADSSLYDMNFSDEIEEVERREHDPINMHMHMSPELEAIEYWCHSSGSMLPDYGITKDMNGKKLDPLMDYDINVITVSGLIVFISLNEDILCRRPYSVYGFAKEIGGFWYQGIPELLKNEQDIANAAARAMVNNLGIASGPQVVIPDINRIPEGEDFTAMYPWKIWQGVNTGGSNAPLVEFFQPDSRAGEMLNIMNSAIRLADTTLEMPAFATGPERVAGAGRTSSGLAMLMSTSNRGLKRVLLGLDRYVYQDIIEKLYDYNMMFEEDDSIKGDMNFMSEGIVSLIMKEQLSDKRINLLQATNNEFDMKILGLDGRAKILSDAMEALESDYDDIKPTRAKIKQLINQEETLQQQRIQENQMRIQKEQAMLERESAVAQAELQIEQQKLQLKAQEIEAKDRNTNKELDIRASKQEQALYRDLINKQEKESQGEMLNNLASFQGGDEDELTATEQQGETGDQTTGG